MRLIRSLIFILLCGASEVSNVTAQENFLFQRSGQLTLAYVSDTSGESDISVNAETPPGLIMLSDYVYDTKCNTARSYFNEWYETGKMAEAEKDFLAAHQLYAYAEKISGEYYECSIDIESIERNKLAIDRAFAYQSMLLDVRALESGMNYAAAVCKYEDAGTYFSENHIASFGLEHPLLADFVLENGSDAFLHYLAELFFENGEAEKSLAAYKSLIERKYFFGPSLPDALFSLGKFIGERDRLSGSEGNPKLLAQHYLPRIENTADSQGKADDDVFKPFVQGFSRGWKKSK